MNLTRPTAEAKWPTAEVKRGGVRVQMAVALGGRVAEEIIFGEDEVPPPPPPPPPACPPARPHTRAAPAQ